MKQLFFRVFFLLFLTSIVSSCNKEKDGEIKFEGKTPNVQIAKNTWPPSINIDIPFEPIRLARSTTDRPRDGKDCGCNECFGICNRPWEGLSSDQGIFASIGVEQLSKSEANIYILNSLPSNFESEFGIDEPVYLKNNSGTILYTIRPGEYNAVHEENFVRCDGNNKIYSYFVKIKVNLD